MKLLSWNLLRLTGATLHDVVSLIEQERPDLMLMQEATHAIDALPSRIGGAYARMPLPGRVHGLAMWMPKSSGNGAISLRLPRGLLVDRVCQILDVGPFTVANVHLSHGQLLNRRQLRRIAAHLPPCAAIVGDYNLVGPVMLRGFRDAGPHHYTHLSADFLPLRLDRCLVRGLTCTDTSVLPRGGSDHKPIMMHLHPHAPPIAPGPRLHP